jgi:hypothetical protein
MAEADLRGVIPSAVQGDGDRPANAAIGLQHTLLLEGLERLIIERENLLRRDRIQAIADLVIAGNLRDLEKTLSVAAPFVLLHRFLVGQKGRRLGEEHAECAGAEILH